MCGRCGSRLSPGLKTENSNNSHGPEGTPRVRRLVGLALIGRLALIWMLLPVKLRRRIRSLTLVRLAPPLARIVLAPPLTPIVLAARIRLRLLTHDALPCTPPLRCPPTPGRTKDPSSVQGVSIRNNFVTDPLR